MDRWMDEARRSYGGECRDRRGKEGTHRQGSLSFARYKEKKVYIYATSSVFSHKVPLYAYFFAFSCRRSS